ncbi:MAG: ribosomal protein uS13 [Patescibacteria group bacterium]
MIRIAGVNIDGKKHARFALTVIKGVGPSNVKIILKNLNMDFTTKLDDLSEEELVKLRNEIDNIGLLESDLRRFNQTNIKRLTDINSHRGLRHKAGLPVRGQTTKTNSRTIRGNKRFTGGSGKTKSAAKT